MNRYGICNCNNKKKTTVNRISVKKKIVPITFQKKYKGPSLLFLGGGTNISIVFLLKVDIAKHMMTLNGNG